MGQRGFGHGAAAACGLANALIASCAWATPEDLFGYGPASQAMGMTGAAVGRGVETVYTNPALLSESRERRLSMGFQVADYVLYANGDHAPGDYDAQSMRGVLIGATLPLAFGGAWKDRVTLGVGFFTPTDLVVRGRILYPEKPRFSVLADRSQSVAIQAATGVDIGYGVRVGAGFAALAAIAGDVLVATNESGQVGTKVDDQLVAAYAPVIGVTYDLDDSYRVGATYREVLDARFAVKIVVQGLGSLEVPPFNIAGLAQYDRRQLQVEAARVRGPWRLAAGVTWRDWSQYTGPPEPTVLCPEDDPDCRALKPPDFGFHDTFSPRVGAERVFEPDEGLSLHVRAGYVLEPTPAPVQSSEMNFSESWEGGIVDAPSVLRVGGEVWMYYAAAGGIGVATSSDGTTFSKRGGPVFGASDDGWDEGIVPTDPSVVQIDDGSFRMFYEAGKGIGEARSDDGVAWERVSSEPALWPVPPPDFPTPEEDTVYEPFDDVTVGDPHAVMDTSALGRRILRVYYAGPASAPAIAAGVSPATISLALD